MTIIRNVRLWPVLLSLVVPLTSCDNALWNSPYTTAEQGENIRYSSFSARPKHLDPALSYSSDEVVFTGQIYEPPYQYHYLKRPYVLEPLTTEALPKVRYYNQAGQQLVDSVSVEQIASSVYEIKIKPGIKYQPHPAFAKNSQGELRYEELSEETLKETNVLADFEHLGSKELTAADYVYQIKRLAHPKLHSPIYGLMSEYILGLHDYSQQLKTALTNLQNEKGDEVFLNLHDYDFPGVEIVDRYTYRITVKGKYQQFIYWLAMPFFAPVPVEVDRFYSQPGMKERNITLDWYPVGTGPFMLVINNPNKQMVMKRNPNYRQDFYPQQGMPGDKELGLLDDAGKAMPFIDKVVYSLEKESIPLWNKFMQGYYDVSGISSDNFDQAIQFGSQGDPRLSEELLSKQLRLITSVTTSNYYAGFNMVDEVVGGDSERARKLRRAISIAIDFEEFVSIFANGRGIPAHGPLPPGIFGYPEGEDNFNPYVYERRDGRVARKSIEQAKQLLKEAGYPEGIDSKTGQPLLLHLDIAASGPGDKARLDWMRKQLQKINLELEVRNTDYNRFREKMSKGNAQIFFWGWNADYPDPENFLFLLYGPNAQVVSGSENSANYQNTEYDRLFDRMKNMANGPERYAVIQQMVAIVQRDAPWVWGMNPKSFGLYHQWYLNGKPNLMANNTLKYVRIDPQLREEKRGEWNQPIVWPLYLFVLLLIVMVAPAVMAYRRRERRSIN